MVTYFFVIFFIANRRVSALPSKSSLSHGMHHVLAGVHLIRRSFAVKPSLKYHQTQSMSQSQENVPSVALAQSSLSASNSDSGTIAKTREFTSHLIRGKNAVPTTTPPPAPSEQWDFDCILTYIFSGSHFDGVMGRYCSLFSYFAWTPRRCPKTVEISNFTIEYEIVLDEFDYLLDNPNLKTAYENAMTNVLNEDNVGSGISFYGFSVKKEVISATQKRRRAATSSQGNRRKAIATGVCQTKHCSVPTSYAFPDKRRRLREENGPFEHLKKFAYVPPVPQYKLHRNREERSITYDARFQKTTEYPWESLSHLAIKQVPDSLASTPTSLCLVSEEQCVIQRLAISTVLNRFGVDYNETENECIWEGVLCNDLHIVIGLSIEKSNSLSTSIVFPTEVLYLPNLTHLDLANTGLAGTMPDISSLTEIKKLSLGNNMLTGSLPSELGLLGNTESLSLVNNAFVGGIPSQLGNLEKLTFLDIGHNTKLGRSIPSHLGKLTHLKMLKLNDCSLTSTLPKSFGALHEIETIILSNNTLEGSISLLSDLTMLNVLQLDNNHFTGNISDAFGKLNHLLIFSIYNNFITGPFPNFLGSLSHLTDIILGKNKITGSVSSNIGALINLTNFDVTNCDITGRLPSEIGRLTNLGVFNVVGNSLTATIPSELGMLSSLEALVLAGNSFTGVVSSELGLMSSLEAIDLGDNSLTGTIPTEFNKLSNLEDIFIAGNDITGDISFLCDLKYVTYNEDNLLAADCGVGREEAIIIELYDAFGLVDYNRGNRSSVCEWTGIECNSHGGIIAIELVGKELSGTLSSVIGKIYNLEILDLSHNSLTGTIPEEISSLLFLKSIVLANNDFFGDAHFFCGVTYEIQVDAREVDLCTTQPSSIPSLSPIPSSAPTSSPIPSSDPTSSLMPSNTPSLSLLPSSSPSHLTWSQLGDDVEGGRNYEEYGRVVTLSRNGNRLWSVGKREMKSYLFDGGPFDPISELTSYEDQGSCGPRGNDAVADSDVCGGGTLYKVHEAPNVAGQTVARIDGCNFYAYTIYNCLSSNRWVFEHDFAPVFPSQVDSMKASADGNTFVAGQPSYSSRGAVLVFGYDGSSWSQKGHVLEGQGPGSYFGASVDITGDATIIAVGAHGHGYVKTYEYFFESWVLRDEVSSPDAQTNFGISVSISDDARRMIVGATYRFSAHGAVFFYDLYPVKLLQRDDGDGTDIVGLGHSVSTSADGVVAVAAGTDSDRRVRVYRANNASAGATYSRLDGDNDGGDDDHHKLGSSSSVVALSSDGTRLAVGAPFHDDGGEEDVGKIHVYTVYASSYHEIGAFVGEGAGEQWGTSIALSDDGKMMAFGAGFVDGSGTNRGRARVYELSEVL